MHAALLLAALSSLAAARKPWEGHIPHRLAKRDALAAFPSGNAVYVGAWTNGQQGYSDTPSAMNARLNLSISVYQFGQRIPLASYDYVAGRGWPAFEYLIDWTNTNANYFLTIYGDEGLGAITDGDIVALGMQLRSYAEAGRECYLRWLPEMQGQWMPYGLQPIEYIALWRRMYAIIKEISPTTIVVWSPNLSVGYPYGNSLSQAPNAADRRALDTDRDGQLTAADDAYAPYFPGEAFVDANGISIYYKGPNFANLNEPQPGGFCADVLNGVDTYNPGIPYTEFYDTYCAQMDKPCIISEIGAAYHVNVAGGVASQTAIQEAFWSDCIANATFLDAFPEIKLINIFEQEKWEEDPNGMDLRDFRVSNVSSIARLFAAALEDMGPRFAFATPTTLPGGGVVQGTALPTTNPVLLGATLRTQTIAALTEVVTWTETSFSSPTPTVVSTQLGGSSTDSPTATAATGLQSASTGNILAVSTSSTSAAAPASSAAAPLLLAALGSLACALLGSWSLF